MAFKKMPTELMFEIICVLRFNRRWARCRVCCAFDHILLGRMGARLKVAKSLANYCTDLARNISSTILHIPINAPGFQVVELPARLIEARKFVKALVRKTDRINNMPRNVALASNNNDVNILLHRAREIIVTECVGTDEALAEDIEKLLEFLLDFYHLITYQYLATVV